MGISLVSAVRLNYDEKLTPIWKDIVYGFRKLSENELAKYGRLNGTHSHGFQFMTYTIEPIKLLPWMYKEFQALGGKIIGGQKVTDLARLGAERNADLIINCTGVWASKVAGDSEIVPLRGQVMRVSAPWLREVVLDERDDGNYVIPK